HGPGDSISAQLQLRQGSVGTFIESRGGVVRERFILLAALACLAGYIYVYSSGRVDSPIRSDAFSYYIYLPSWLLFHDPSLQAVANDCCAGAFPPPTPPNPPPPP